jgi:hypothetical protein
MILTLHNICGKTINLEHSNTKGYMFNSLPTYFLCPNNFFGVGNCEEK